MKLNQDTVLQMGREYPDWGASYIRGKMRLLGLLASKHHLLCEDYCNVDDPTIPDRLDKLEQRIEQRTTEYFPGTVAITERDPRGATVKLLPPSGATNDWGRIGLCVLA